MDSRYIGTYKPIYKQSVFNVVSLKYTSFVEVFLSLIVE
jgi:hypothetical protein